MTPWCSKHEGRVPPTPLWPGPVALLQQLCKSHKFTKRKTRLQQANEGETAKLHFSHPVKARETRHWLKFLHYSSATDKGSSVSKSTKTPDFFQEMLADLFSEKAFSLAKPLLLTPTVVNHYLSLFSHSSHLSETNNSMYTSVILPLKVHRRMDLKDHQKAHTMGNKCVSPQASICKSLGITVLKSKPNKRNKLHKLRMVSTFFCSSNAESRLLTPWSRS